MRRITILFVLFLVASANAQSRIDSIAIDEAAHQVGLFGSFPITGSLKVLCDSVELPLSSRTSTILRATIPDSGKGSCGWLYVSSEGETSNSKLITYWHFLNYYSETSIGTLDGYDQYQRTDTVFLRGDLLSIYSTTDTLKVHPVTLSRFLLKHDGHDDRNGFRFHGERYSINDTLTSVFSITRGSLIDTFAHLVLKTAGGGYLHEEIRKSGCQQPPGGICDWTIPSLTLFPVKVASAAFSHGTSHRFEIRRSGPRQYTIESDLPSRIRILSIDGRSITEGSVEHGITEIDLGNLARGIYLFVPTNQELAAKLLSVD